MDWMFPQEGTGTTDPNGLERIMEMLSEALGGERLPGTRFLFDEHDMMRATREIEEASTTELLVGFQWGSHLDREEDTYRKLLERGVRITGYGTGQPGVDLPVTWIDVPFDRLALENQWFLIIEDPEPLAFVGYELSDIEHFGQGGVSDERRRFAGFVSPDVRIVRALRAYLAGVDVKQAPGPGGFSPTVITDQLRSLAGQHVKRILVTTDDRATSAPARRAAVALAKDLGAEVVLFDHAAESYLVDPYPFVEVADGSELLDPAVLRFHGRDYLAEQILEAKAQGVAASAWLPQGVGATALLACIDRFGCDSLVLPDSFERPSLFERVRGNVLAKVMKSTNVPVFLASRDMQLHPAVIPA